MGGGGFRENRGGGGFSQSKFCITNRGGFRKPGGFEKTGGVCPDTRLDSLVLKFPEPRVPIPGFNEVIAKTVSANQNPVFGL